jgi:hypothetical protein
VEKPLSTLSAVDLFEQRHVRAKAGRTFIVGSFIAPGKVDRRAMYPDSLGVDMREGAGVDRVLDLEEELPGDLGTFAHVECWSVLEHARRPWLLAANLELLMEPGATIHLRVPFVWRFHSYPGDLWRFTHEGVRQLFCGIEWEALMYASDVLQASPKLKAVTSAGQPHFPRCEVVGFGVKVGA